MSYLTDELKYLSEEYESGEHVDISAQNYFQDALEEIMRLRTLAGLAFEEGYKRGHIERGQHSGSSWYMSKSRRALEADDGEEK